MNETAGSIGWVGGGIFLLTNSPYGLSVFYHPFLNIFKRVLQTYWKLGVTHVQLYNFYKLAPISY